jgi:amino-acid N-acetyltransferase
MSVEQVPEASLEQKVNWLRQSAPYINAHRGSTFVLMLSGETIAHANFINTVHDIALLNSLGIRLVLAIGARPQIEQQLKLEKLESRFHQGLRITSETCLQTVKRAVGAVRAELEALLSTGVINSPMHGASIRVVSGNFVTAKPIGVREGIDFCFTGQVRKVARKPVTHELDQGHIVLLPCLGYSPSGEVFNLSVEDVATQTAIAIHADKLITFCDQPGAQDEQGKLLRELTPGDCASLINSAISTSSQQQALRACYQAIHSHVPRAHIISYCTDGALLTELLSRDGSGTLITQASFEQVRPAQIHDVGGILQLISPLEEQGVLVRRSRELLETEIDNFTVIERDGMIIACIALYPFAEENSAEVACVVTHPDYQKSSRASLLLQHVEKQARNRQINTLFVLTTQTAHWFLEKGFSEKSLNTLPEAKQKLYNLQRNSKVFVKKL